MKWVSVVVSALVVGFLATGNGWAADSDSRKVTVFFSGMVQGTFEPCGCPESPSGGLARRAGYSGAFRKANGGAVLHVDSGNYFRPLGPGSADVNRLMLESLDELPIQVLNLAPGDLFYWRELSSAELKRSQVISTNLRPRDASLPAPAPYAVVELPADQLNLDRPVRIGFLGLSRPSQVPPNSGFVGIDSFEAFERVKDEVLKKADFLIVLADLPREEALSLAELHPEVYAVLITERRFVLHPVAQVNNAVILNSVERGRYLGQLELELDSSGGIVAYRPDAVELREGVPEDPAWLKRQNRLATRIP